MAVILGLAVAVTYGAADFLGGLSSKRTAAWAVVVISQVCALPLIAVLVVVGGGQPTARALGVGVLAGIGGAVGLSSFYRALATGRMSVVAPITGVGAALVPLLWGLGGRGERPSGLALAGAALAVVAVVLVSRAPDAATGDAGNHSPARSRAVLGLAVVAGVAFGAVFVALAETGPRAGFWPLASARCTSIILITAVSRAAGHAAGRIDRQDFPPIAATGVLDVAANALFLLATRRGLLSVVAVVASLYPATTVLLARLVLHENLRPVQVGGLGLALTGIALMAGG